MPKKRVQIKRNENKWVTTGIRVSGNRLRLLNILKKEGHMSEETKKKNTIVITKEYISKILGKQEN
jgi:hypothetical protein